MITTADKRMLAVEQALDRHEAHVENRHREDQHRYREHTQQLRGMIPAAEERECGER